MKYNLMNKEFNEDKNLIIEESDVYGAKPGTLYKILENIIDSRARFLSFDLNKEFVNKNYNKLQEKGYNVVTLNLQDISNSDSWNPLEYPYIIYKKGNIERAEEYLRKMSKVLFYDEQNLDPFWSSTAEDLFVGITLALFDDGNVDKINFNSINYMINEIDKKSEKSDYMIKYFKSKGDSSRSYNLVSTTLLAPDRTQDSILSVAREKLQCVLRKELAPFINKTSFSFEDIKNCATAIIFITNDKDKALNAIASIFIEQLYEILADMEIESGFYFILNNFDTIKKLDNLQSILETCVEKNIKIYMSTKSIKKFENVYGRHTLELCNLLLASNVNKQENNNNSQQRYNETSELAQFKI